MPAFRDFEEKDLDRLERFIQHLAGSGVKPGLAITGDPRGGASRLSALCLRQLPPDGHGGAAYTAPT